MHIILCCVGQRFYRCRDLFGGIRFFLHDLDWISINLALRQDVNDVNDVDNWESADEKVSHVPQFAICKPNRIRFLGTNVCP